jgi:hypothetical protein
MIDREAEDGEGFFRLGARGSWKMEGLRDGSKRRAVTFRVFG